MNQQQGQPVPDLATILQTLAQSQTSISKHRQQAVASSTSAVQDGYPHSGHDATDDGYDPTRFRPITKPQQTRRPESAMGESTALRTESHGPKPPPQHSSADLPATSPSRSLSASRPSGPSTKNSSQITTWAPALRCVTNMIAQDATIIPQIRKLRRSQHDHETQWWAGREQLLKTQRERGAGRAQIEAILKGVGGTLNTHVQGPTAEEDTRELHVYDIKVHRAASQMHKAFARELKELGIPFFCTDVGLLEGDSREGKGMASTSPALLSPNELRDSQLKMIQLLEDLSGD